MLKQSKITAFFRPSNVNQSDDQSKHLKQSNSSEKQFLNKSNTNPGTDKNETITAKRKFDNSELVEDKSRNEKYPKSGRVCPFYKKIPHTNFVVDAFSYGSIPNVNVYFLTHFHSDHYQGLHKSFKHIIYCSPITARLVRHHYKNGLFTLKELNINGTEVIEGVNVTFFDANHCPGSVMILFVLQNGLRYLHTGDFRACIQMHSYSQLISAPIDQIFLDTTYCDPKYDFPPQKKTLELIVSISSEAVKKNSKLLIVCGSYSIGKENVFIAIAKALNLNVWTNSNKRQVYKCYDNPTINSLLVSNRDRSKLHVLPMSNLNFKFLEKYLQDFKGVFNEILAFTPTGWEFKSKSLDQVKPRKYNNVTIYGIPYSEHSSFSELQRFITFFKPFKVIPTVNNGKEEMRNKINHFIQQWINGSNDSVDNGNEQNKKQINGSIKSWIRKVDNSTSNDSQVNRMQTKSIKPWINNADNPITID